MNILERYIGAAVIGGALLVLAVLLGLFSFIAFLAELDSVGQGDYGAWQAIQYVILMLPRLAYQLFPLAALLGTLIGLGTMASHNELLVMRATGISLQAIIIAVLKAGFVLMLCAIALSELAISPSEQAAQDLRASALAGHAAQRTQEGFWTRSGRNFINVRTVLADGRLAGIQIYEFGEDATLRRITDARRATYQNGTWLLQDIRRTELEQDRVLSQYLSESRWLSLLDPAVLDIIAIRPDSLSAVGLFRYIRYLQDNELDARRYKAELWRKMVLPLATAVTLSFPALASKVSSLSSSRRCSTLRWTRPACRMSSPSWRSPIAVRSITYCFNRPGARCGSCS